MNLAQAKHSERLVWAAADDLGEMARRYRSTEAAEFEQKLRKLAWEATQRVIRIQREEASK